MIKIGAGKSDPDKYFNLRGIDYKKGNYTIYYRDIEQNDDQEVIEEKLKVGIKQEQTNESLQVPILVSSWADLDGVPYSDLQVLLTDLSDFLGFNTGGAESESGAYEPVVQVTSFTPSIIETDNTTEIVVSGSFLDYVDDISVSAPNQAGVSVSLVSNSFNEMVLEITTNVDVQTYSIVLKTPNGQEFTLEIQAENISIYTPSATGVAPSLWVKLGTNNGTIVTNGGYEAENSGGNGWNEHAYFGSFTSSSRLEFSFEVDRLQGASNAYCFINFSTQNTATTGGTPRVYISNGSNFQVYSPTGANIGSTTISVGDVVNVVLEPNKYEVFLNGVSVGVYNGAVNMTNVFMNFTGYRVAKLSNINAKVY